MSKQKEIQISVDETFLDLVPRPSKEQRKALKESIEEIGQQEPIIVDSTGKILDGHTRFEICQELHLKPKYIIKQFADEEAKRTYAVTVNLKRRHLNDYQIFELLQSEFKKIQDRNEEQRRKTISGIRKGIIEPHSREYNRSKSITQLSQLSGIKEQTLEQCKAIKESGNLEIEKQVRSGVLKPREGYLILRKKGTLKKKLVSLKYRSKLEITYDMLNQIKNNSNIAITRIFSLSNVSFNEGKVLFDLLEENGIIKTAKSTTKYANYPKSKYEIKTFLLTEKGNNLFATFNKLYEYLPLELTKHERR